VLTQHNKTRLFADSSLLKVTESWGNPVTGRPKFITAYINERDSNQGAWLDRPNSAYTTALSARL